MMGGVEVIQVISLSENSRIYHFVENSRQDLNIRLPRQGTVLLIN